MTVTRREAWAIQGGPAPSLLRLNRNNIPNILVVGGDASGRRAMARSLHASSSLRELPFCALHAGRDHVLLRCAVLSWLGYGREAAPLACDRGMLFLDAIEQTPVDLQRLLFGLARRLTGLPWEQRLGPGPARIAAGCAGDPVELVEQGIFLAPLHDSLDKLLVRLESEARPRGTIRGLLHQGEV